jgi:disulfide bond formation protein DsbB
MRSEQVSPLKSHAYQLGGWMLFLAAAVILAALAFEYIGQYAPCPLCLVQRYAYYAGVPLLFVSLILLSAEKTRLAALVFFIVSLAFLANSGLGVYQAGAEYGFWPGPQSCSGGQEVTNSADSLLADLQTTKVPRCDQPEFWFLGLSFAGWNVLISFVIFVGTLKAAFASAERRQAV